MIKDYSYWIIPVYKNNDWTYEILVINQKTYNWSFRGFPKWHAEEGEDGLTAAIRELQEEVWIENIKLDDKKYGWFGYNFEEKWIKYDKTVKYRLWFVENKEIKIQEDELNWYKRANYDDALNILSHKNMKDVFKDMIKYLAPAKTDLTS